MTLEQAKSYCRWLEDHRQDWEPHNKRAYQNARELSALISIAEHGTGKIKASALKAIKSIQ